MSIFGNTAIGSASLSLDVNSKYAGRFYKSATGAITALKCHAGADAGGAATFRMGVHADSGGAAGALVGVATAISVPAGSARGVRALVPVGSFGSAPGWYWLVVHTADNRLNLSCESSGGTSQEKANIYSDGLSDPFGGSGTGTRNFSMWAEYADANTAPNAPTITSPLAGANVVVSQINRVSYTYSDPDGDTQLKSELDWYGAGTWHTIYNNTPLHYVDIPAGTLSVGTAHPIRLRCYDEHGLVGTYCTAITLNGIAAPAGPTMTAPASDDEVIITAVKSVTWTVDNQVSAEVRRVANLGTDEPDNATVYETVATSGSAAVQAACRSLDVTFDTDNRTEHVQVRVEYPALTWSAWADDYTDASECRVAVAFAAPAVPIITVTADDTNARISVSAQHPTPFFDQPTVVSMDIYRKEYDAVTGTYGDYIRIAAGLAPTATYHDYAVASGVDYIYRVRAIGSTGATADSDGSPVVYYYEVITPETEEGFEKYLDDMRWFKPAGVNIMTNGSFPVNLTDNWYAPHAELTVTRVTSPPVALPDEPDIIACARIQANCTAARNWNHFGIAAAEAGNEYLLSHWAYAPAIQAGTHHHFRAYIYKAGVFSRYVADSDLATNAAFARRSFSVTLAADEDGIGLRWYSSTGTCDIYVTGIMIEKNSVLAKYYEGGLTANSLLKYSTGLPLPIAIPQATIAGRIRHTWPHTAASYQTIIQTRPTLGGFHVRYKTSGVIGAEVVDGVDDQWSQKASLTWADGDESVFVARHDEDTVDFSIDGVDAVQTAHGVTFAESTDIESAGVLGTGTQGGGYRGPFVFSPTRKDDTWTADIQAGAGAVFDSLGTLWGMMAVGDVLFPWGTDSDALLKVGTAVLCFDGNSLTKGFVRTGDAYYPYPDVAVAALSTWGWRFTSVNTGVGGDNLSDLIATHAAVVDAAYDATKNYNILTVLAGQNLEGAEVSYADRLAQLESYCLARQAVGWKVVVCTLPSYSWEPSSVGNDYRTEFNASVRANWAAYADALADVAADSRIGDNGDWADGTYFADSIHMEPAGYDVMASPVIAAIRGLLV